MADGSGGPDGPDETGRSDFDREVYPRAYPVPGRLNLEKAMRAYVHGHDRGWEAERKGELAGEVGPGEEGEGFAGAGQALDRGERTERPGADSASAPEPEETREGRRYGIPVPEELSFHRGADTWRDRIPRPRSSRRPAGWPEGGPGNGEDRAGG